MSQENLEVLRRALDAFNRRDKASWIAVCDPEAENRPAREWPESAPIPGAEAIWDYFVESVEAWDEGSFTLGEVIDVAEDTVVANERREMRGRASGASVAWSYWVVIRFRNGRMLRFEWFADRAEALEAAGLSE